MKKQKKVIGILVAVILVMAALITVLLLWGGKGKKYRAQLDLGKKYVEAEDYEKALEHFEAAMKIEPKEEEPYLCMAQVYEIQNHYEEMAEILKLGCERAGTERLEEELSRAEELLEVSDDGNQGEEPEETAAVDVTGEELAGISRTADVLLDWNLHEGEAENVYYRETVHVIENLLESGKHAGDRRSFLLRCCRNMETLYPGKLEDLAANYAQLGAYFEEWAWHYPAEEKPAPAFDDWGGSLDLSWVALTREGMSYSVANGFYLNDFNRMLADVFGGQVPAVTPEELEGYRSDDANYFTHDFLYDSTHGVMCRIVEDGRTGGEWEPQSTFHNYVTKAVKTGGRIELEIQKLSVDGEGLYYDLVSDRYEDLVSSLDMSKADYWNTQGKIYTGKSGQPLAIDGREIIQLQAMHSSLEDFETTAYEDMEQLEFDRETGERYMTGPEVFAKLQANSARLLSDPGIAGPYLKVGNQYKVVLEEKDGYYRFTEVTQLP